MTDLPSELREQLANEFDLFTGQVVQHQVAGDRTEKLLVELVDGKQIECVLMREPRRWTACISTQVGCAMGCVFCASGLLGLDRNLSRTEILEQVLRLTRRLEPGERLTNIVVMGIGEPLANLTQLLEALEEVHAEDGLGLSPRRITISTVGLPKGIRQLAAIGRPYTLAVSLPAPNAALRAARTCGPANPTPQGPLQPFGGAFGAPPWLLWIPLCHIIYLLMYLIYLLICLTYLSIYLI